MQPRFKLGGYVEIDPPAILRRSVQAGWIHASRIDAPAAVHRVVPDPCLSIAFACRRDAAGRVVEPRLLFVGPVRSPRVTTQTPGSELVAVRFFPEWGQQFLGIHPGEHPDAVVDLASVTDRGDRSLPERLEETRSPLDALHVMMTALAREAATMRDPSGCDALASHASAVLRRSGGSMEMDRLAALHGVSGRHLRRAFRAPVGLSPKTLAGMLRFQRLLLASDLAATPDWADLALQCGYADQAHMIREFKRLTGATPAALHRERRAESDSFNL